MHRRPPARSRWSASRRSSPPRTRSHCRSSEDSRPPPPTRTSSADSPDRSRPSHRRPQRFAATRKCWSPIPFPPSRSRRPRPEESPDRSDARRSLPPQPAIPALHSDSESGSRRRPSRAPAAHSRHPPTSTRRHRCLCRPAAARLPHRRPQAPQSHVAPARPWRGPHIH
jgi:hypothetical protein